VHPLRSHRVADLTAVPAGPAAPLRAETRRTGSRSECRLTGSQFGPLLAEHEKWAISSLATPNCRSGLTAFGSPEYPQTESLFHGIKVSI
jgi:hypothetical protein